MAPAEIYIPAETRPAPLLRRLASFIDRRPDAVLPLWIAAYFGVIWRAAHRPLWFDELMTVYASTAPTTGSYLHTRFIDLTPPLHYLFVRASIALLGDSPFAARLPSMLGFLMASLIVYRLVTRRLGGALGLAALGIFWSSSLTVYAVEARAYGLLLGLFTIAMLSWSNAILADRWTAWHAGMTIAIAAMFLTHCFSLPFAAAIGAGELVRAITLKRIDKRVWVALIAPLAILPAYLPLIRSARALLCPPLFAATWITIPKFYLAVLAPLLPAIGAILVIWLAMYGRGRRVLWGELGNRHEIGFAIAAVAAPLVTMCYSHWSGSPYWIRYGIGTIPGITLILTGVLAVAVRRNPNVAAASAGLILMLFCATQGGTGTLADEYENTTTAYRAIRPDLPFVAASGLTFLEMDQRETPEFIHRLFYLTDKESALRYHTNIFEGMPVLKEWFPVRANVAPYRDFTSRNRQFLVLGTSWYPEDWLLRKLQEDGAQIRLLATMKTGHHDSEIYEITMPNRE